MEELYNGEQLENQTQSKENALTQTEEKEVAQGIGETGSLISKFKNFSELEKAYVNLEKEFTKKCQALKDLKAHVSDNAEEKPSAPQYMQEGWVEKVQAFFEQNPQAKQFANDISQLIASDKVLASSENSLELAYEKVKANNYKTNDELLNDPNFMETYIFNNPVVKEKIIGDYLSQVVSKKSVPLMSNFSGGNVMVTPKTKPTSLKEAGDYMVALMNNK